MGTPFASAEGHRSMVLGSKEEVGATGARFKSSPGENLRLCFLLLTHSGKLRKQRATVENLRSYKTSRKAEENR